MIAKMNISDELVDEIARRAAQLVQVVPEDGPRWVDKNGAADHLGFSVSKIEKLTAKGEIPLHRHEGRIHYRTDELDAWLLSL